MAILDQIAPMKYQDYEDLYPYELKEIEAAPEEWASETKIDGCHMKLHITEDGLRLDGAEPSSKTGLYREYTQNFPHIAAAVLNKVPPGTVFDAEIFLVDTDLSTSVVLSNPERATLLQEEHGPANLYIFDIIRWPKRNMKKTAYAKRRNMLEKMFVDNIELAACRIHLVDQRTDTEEHYNNVIAGGGEGVVLKKLSAGYFEGRRARIALKRKELTTVDGWVCGYTAGTNGRIGALKVADSEGRTIAAVTLSKTGEREWLSDPDGSLKEQFYGRGIEVKGNGWTKNGFVRHAEFVRWRPERDREPACRK